MARTEPTVGRMVHYWPADTANDDVMHILDPKQPFSAQIVWLCDSGLIGVVIHDQAGHRHFRVVPLRQGDEVIALPFCEWMDFQKGQAAKTEQLEAALAIGAAARAAGPSSY